MTDAEMLSRIYQAVERIRKEGREFGKVELIVRDGVIKHVNVSYEILSDRQSGGEDEKERRT